MCLALAARTSPNSPQFNQNLVAYATQAFFKYGGTPHLDAAVVGVEGADGGEVVGEARLDAGGRTTGRVGGRGATLMGQAVMRRPDVIFSDSHNAFSLFLARLLMVVWNQPIEVLLGVGGESGSGGLTLSQLARLEQQLAALRDFLETNPNFAPIPSDLRRREGADGPPSRIEPESMDLADLEGDLNSSSRVTVQTRLKNLYQRKYDEEAKRMEQRSLANMHLLLKVRCPKLLSLTITNYTEIHRTIRILVDPQRTRFPASV